MQAKAVTTRMIAERLGVSHSTVARVLRNDGRISPATSEKVKRCAKRMGYRANPLIQAYAQRIRGGKTSKGTGILAWVDDMREESEWLLPWHHRLRKGAYDRAKELGYTFERFEAHHQVISPQRLVRILRARAIRGVLMPMTLTTAWEAMAADDLAVVVLGPPVMGQQYLRVTSDDHFNVSLAYRQALALGYRRIGFVTTCYQLDATQGTQLSSYLLQQQHVPLEQRLPYVISDHPKHRVPRRSFERWMKRHKPDAILCNHHQLIDWVEGSGREVPKDIGLIHLNLAPDVRGWTGIDALTDQQGALAVDALNTQLVSNRYGRPDIHQEVLIKGQWVPGKTTTPRRETSNDDGIAIPTPYFHRRWYKSLPQ